MKPHIHYEVAFENYLLSRQIAFVAVDESRRAAFRDAKLKSFDFVVYSGRGAHWLVDIKGRRWSPRGGRRPAWENWVTQADLDCLEQWESVFGGDFRALLVFAYWARDGAPPPPEIAHKFRGELYVFAATPLDEYRLHARVRSPKWGTINVPVREFARAVRPIADLV